MFLDSVTHILYLYELNHHKLVIDSVVKFIATRDGFINVHSLSRELVATYVLFKKKTYSDPYPATIRINHMDYRSACDDELYGKLKSYLYFVTPVGETRKWVIISVE